MSLVADDFMQRQITKMFVLTVNCSLNMCSLNNKDDL